jgi:hypothetical protein
VVRKLSPGMTGCGLSNNFRKGASREDHGLIESIRNFQRLCGMQARQSRMQRRVCRQPRFVAKGSRVARWTLRDSSRDCSSLCCAPLAVRPDPKLNRDSDGLFFGGNMHGAAEQWLRVPGERCSRQRPTAAKIARSASACFVSARTPSEASILQKAPARNRSCAQVCACANYFQSTYAPPFVQVMTRFITMNISS